MTNELLPGLRAEMERMMKKSRTINAITPDKIAKIALLMGRGLNKREIAGTLEMGESTAGRYMAILTAIRDGQPIPFTTDVYKQNAVIEYCKRNGLEYKTNAEKGEQSETISADANPRVNALYDYAVVLEHLADTLTVLSASLMQIYAETAEERT